MGVGRDPFLYIILYYIMISSWLFIVWCWTKTTTNKEKNITYWRWTIKEQYGGPNPEKVGCGDSNNTKKASPKKKHPRADLPAGDDAGRRSELLLGGPMAPLLNPSGPSNYLLK